MEKLPLRGSLCVQQHLPEVLEALVYHIYVMMLCRQEPASSPMCCAVANPAQIAGEAVQKCVCLPQPRSCELAMVWLALPGTIFFLHSWQRLWHLQLVPERLLGMKELMAACRA